MSAGPIVSDCRCQQQACWCGGTDVRRQSLCRVATGGCRLPECCCRARQGGQLMHEPQGSHEPAEMRASDQERDKAATQLGEHAAVGRLTLDELEERVSRALVAKTRGELEALTRDLPGQADIPGVRRNAVRRMVAVMGGSRRRGRFRLHGAVNVVAIMGGDDIDLRDAELDGGEVTLNLIAIM